MGKGMRLINICCQGQADEQSLTPDCNIILSINFVVVLYLKTEIIINYWLDGCFQRFLENSVLYFGKDMRDSAYNFANIQF